MGVERADETEIHVTEQGLQAALVRKWHSEGLLNWGQMKESRKQSLVVRVTSTSKESESYLKGNSENGINI